MHLLHVAADHFGSRVAHALDGSTPDQVLLREADRYLLPQEWLADGRVVYLSSPDQTNAENFYYVKQMQAKTPMVFVLRDGETLHGVIEWYDKSCLKVNRTEGANLLLYKPNIKYMYKDGERNS